MAKRDGEVSPRTAAKILDVHVFTVRRWIWAATGGDPSPLPVEAIRVTPARRYWIKRTVIESLVSRY